MAISSGGFLKWISDQHEWHLKRRIATCSNLLTTPFRVKKIITGQRNRVLNWAVKTTRASIKVCGHDNTIQISKNAKMGRVSFDIQGSGNRIVIGDGTILEKVSFYIVGNGSNIEIGRQVYIGGASLVAAESGTSITLGDFCMLANDIVIRTGDSHGIFDRTSGARLNPGADVRIGSKVWLAHRVMVLKGVTIPDGCIVGTGAIVTKTLDTPHAVYGGHPARKLRDNVAWGWGLEGFD